MAENQVQKLSHKHEAILNFMVEFPEVPLGEVAKEFGMTQAWLSVVINSDAFKALRAKRSEELFADIRGDVRAKFEGIASSVADKLLDHIDADTMSVRELQSTADLAVKAIGLGGNGGAQRSGGNVYVQNNIGIPAGVDRSQLAEARAMIGVNHERTEAESRRLPATIDQE